MILKKFFRCRAASGFTLIELMVVMVILAVLAAIVLPKFYDQKLHSKEAVLRDHLWQIRGAITRFQYDTGAYPAVLSDLSVSAAPANGLDSSGNTKAITASDWHGPYIVGSVPNDPVSKSAFAYTVTGSTTGTLSSSASGSGLDGTAYSTW